MLLVTDVGNTEITVGLFHGDELVKNWRLTTGIKRTSDEWPLESGLSWLIQRSIYRSRST
jgi:type III pantothenate kinase